MDADTKDLIRRTIVQVMEQYITIKVWLLTEDKSEIVFLMELGQYTIIMESNLGLPGLMVLTTILCLIAYDDNNLIYSFHAFKKIIPVSH